MKRFKTRQTYLLFIFILSVFLITGCGGGETGHWLPPDTTAPMVTAVVPLNNATGVATNTKITATFSEDMDPLTINGTTFTVVNTTLGGTAVAGNVTYAVASRTATFTPTTPATLPFSTRFTAMITTGAKDLAGNALASNFIWSFRTGVIPSITRPRVTLTAPVTTIPGPTLGVPANTAITATFTKDMAPATIIAPATFTLTCTLPCVSPAGIVTYAVGSRTAVFTPAAVLTFPATYTATITTAATDLTGNALAGNQAALPAASDYIWTFSTIGPVAPANVSVASTNPATGAGGVCPNAGINATFTVPSGFRMDPLTVDATTFTVTGPAPAVTTVTAASVLLDVATGRIATLTPLNPLAVGTYTATIKGGAAGVKDLAVPGNTMLSDYNSPLPLIPWTFTVVPATGACLAPPDLGAADTLAIASAAGVTNTATAPNTTINGDVVLHPTATCNGVPVDAAGGFGLCGGFPPTINGQVISPLYPDPGATSGAIKADLLAAYLSMMPANLSGATVLGCGTIGTGGGAGAGVGCAGNATLPPGVYISLTASTIGVTGVLTLDGQGNANSQFIFQAPSALTTAAGAPGVPGSEIRLINGAKASNVWWQVGSSATIGTYALFQGNVLADSSITMGTGATSCGRLLAGAFTASGAFVFDSNVVSVPGNGCPF
jgi:hypothetical protein